MRLRQVDLDFFAAGGASPFALAGYGAAPMATEAVEAVVELGFTVSRERVVFTRRARFACERDDDSAEAVMAYVMPALVSGCIVDRVAWHPRSDRIASEVGVVGLLGADRLDDRLDPDPLAVYPNPRDWLAGWRRGVCIVDEAKARAELLACGRALQAASLDHGAALEAMLRKVRLPKIVIPANGFGRAAA